MNHLLGLGLVLFVVATPAVGWGQSDPKDWTPIKIRGDQKAPEFADIDAWLNSGALEMKKLKGKVVVVHFMAFG